MLSRPEGCHDCSLNTTSAPGFCPDKIGPNPEYLFIAEAPGKNEIIEAEPMVGQAGFVLKQWMMPAVPSLKLAHEKGKIGFANVLRCLPKEVQGRAYPTGKDREAAEKHCRQYDNWPESAKTVVLFGEHSQRLFFGLELAAEDATDRALGHEVKGVSGRMGRVYEKDGRRYVFAPHPAWVLRQPSLVQAAQESLKIAAGVDKPVVVDYTLWSQAMEALK